MRTDFHSLMWLCVVLVAVTCAAYWGVVISDFVDYDDREYVYQNQNVLQGLSLSGLRYAWTTFDCGNWHPLTWISLQSDVSVWGKGPFGFHLTNLILHATNSVLVVIVFYRMTSALLCSTFVAAFFALHPLHVESVAWISERKDVLSTLFLLLTLVAYERYTRSGSVLRYLLVAVQFALGLLAKSMLVTLPVLLFLLDIWPMNRIGLNPSPSEQPRYPKCSLTWLILEKLPLLGMALVDGLMTIAAQKVHVSRLGDIELSTRIANALHAYAWYLQKTFVPTNLIVIYPHPEHDLLWSSVIISALVIVGISLWAGLRFRQAGYLLFGWAWFVISLLPVIGLIQVGAQAHADRYAYIPHIGLFTAIVWQIFSLTKRWKWSQIPVVVVAVCAVIACGLLTETQVYYWKDSATLWTHALNVDPDNYVTHEHLAGLSYKQGNFEQAAKHFERTLRNKRMQSNANACVAWGFCLSQMDRPADAETQFKKALKINRRHANAKELLIELLQKQGRMSEAETIGKEFASGERDVEEDEKR